MENRLSLRSFGSLHPPLRGGEGSAVRKTLLSYPRAGKRKTPATEVTGVWMAFTSSAYPRAGACLRERLGKGDGFSRGVNNSIRQVNQAGQLDNDAVYGVRLSRT